MRIAIVAPSSVPFRLGGAERAWNGLLAELIRNTPHQADLIKLPAPEQSLVDVVQSYEAFARLDLSGFDLLITTKYPAWMTSHPRHVVYVFHPLRALYDLYPKGLPRLVGAVDTRVHTLQALLRRRPERELLDEVFGSFHELVVALGENHPVLAFPGPLARELVHFLDRIALDPRYVVRHLASRERWRVVASTSRRVWCRKCCTSLRTSTASAPAASNTSSPRVGWRQTSAFICSSRRCVTSDPRFRSESGEPDPNGTSSERLSAADTRITFLGSLSDTELLNAYADALAVPVVPSNEGSGSSRSRRCAGKAVITCRDSGGPTEFVEHGRTGLVTDPTPEALAAAIDRLASDPVLARRLGQEGRRRAEAITWRGAVTRLVQSGMGPTGDPRRLNRTKIVIASTARIHPPGAASERRTAALAAALAEEFDVEIVSLGGNGYRPSSEVVAEGVVETIVPESAWQAQETAQTAEELGLPVGDLRAVMAETPRSTSLRLHGPAGRRRCSSSPARFSSRLRASCPGPSRSSTYAHRAEASALGADTAGDGSGHAGARARPPGRATICGRCGGRSRRRDAPTSGCSLRTVSMPTGSPTSRSASTLPGLARSPLNAERSGGTDGLRGPPRSVREPSIASPCFSAAAKRWRSMPRGVSPGLRPTSRGLPT